MKRRHFLSATAAVTSLGLAGCTGDDGGDDEIDSDDIVDTIVLESREFNPLKISIDVQDALEWENAESERAEIRPIDDLGDEWDIELDLAEGETGTYRFDSPGIFAFRERHRTSWTTCGAVAVGDNDEDDIPPLPCE